jgi:hypothetical protein
MAYASGLFLGGLIGELWRMRFQPGYSPELGFRFAFIVLILFSFIYAFMIFAYGEASRFIRDEEEPEALYGVSALIGFPFWFIILPLHKFIRSQLGLPDATWLIESLVLCAVSFEAIRLYDRWRNSKKIDQ